MTELYPFLESKKCYLLFKGTLWSLDLLVKTIHTVPHIADYKLKGEVCIWSSVGALRVKVASNAAFFQVTNSRFCITYWRCGPLLCPIQRLLGSDRHTSGASAAFSSGVHSSHMNSLNTFASNTCRCCRKLSEASFKCSATAVPNSIKFSLTLVWW